MPLVMGLSLFSSQANPRVMQSSFRTSTLRFMCDPLYQHGKVCVLVAMLQQTVNQAAHPGDSQPKLIKVLRELWDDVVCPVVESLDKLCTSDSGAVIFL